MYKQTSGPLFKANLFFFFFPIWPFVRRVDGKKEWKVLPLNREAACHQEWNLDQRQRIPTFGINQLSAGQALCFQTWSEPPGFSYGLVTVQAAWNIWTWPVLEMSQGPWKERPASVHGHKHVSSGTLGIWDGLCMLSLLSFISDSRDHLPWILIYSSKKPNGSRSLGCIFLWVTHTTCLE